MKMMATIPRWQDGPPAGGEGGACLSVLPERGTC